MEEYRDNNNDGVVDVKYTNTLDANGHVIEQATDVNNDGVVDKVERYTLDAQGRPEFIYVDNGANNVVDRIEGVTRNANGHIIQRDYYIGDTITTTPNAIRTYEVDANGQVLKEFNDSNADGQVDSIISYVKDVYGRNVEVQTDTNADGTVDRLTTYTYDANNGILSAKTPNNVILYELDDSGLHKTTHVYDSTGTNHQYDTLITRNELGQMSRIDYDYNFDGIGDGYYTNYIYNNIYNSIDIAYGTSRQYVNGTLTYPEGVTVYTRDTLDNVLYITYSTGSQTPGEAPIQSMSFGYWGGTSPVNHTEDFTTWNSTKLNEFQNGLSRMMLSDSTASTTITLDKNVVNKIASSNLLITGDEHDTVILKGFTEEDKTKSSTNHDFYTVTSEDGSSHVLQIENDINVVFS